MPTAEVIEIRAPSGKSFENAIRAGLAKARKRDAAEHPRVDPRAAHARQREPGDQRAAHEHALSGAGR